jgi:chemotaxis protein methyltransferase CheR
LINKVHSENIFNGKLKEISPVSKRTEFPINCREVADILKNEEGKPNAVKTLEAIEQGAGSSLSGGCIAACAMYFLSCQDFSSVDTALCYLEKYNSSEITRFLRGEYFYLQDKQADAEQYYQEASVKNRMFWPAFYRIASFAAEGNRTRYEYKIRKAIESIELCGKEKYEFFMGGFSPDYFRRILEKKLA